VKLAHDTPRAWKAMCTPLPAEAGQRSTGVSTLKKKSLLP